LGPDSHFAGSCIFRRTTLHQIRSLKHAARKKRNAEEAEKVELAELSIGDGAKSGGYAFVSGASNSFRQALPLRLCQTD